MEPKFRTSFIPKQPIVATPAKSSRRGGGLLFLLALIIFLAAVILAGAVFLYQQYLKQAITSNKASLERARAAFEPALIQELERLDSRITVAGGLLGKHAAPTELFTLLADNTLQDVRFSDFNYTAAPDKITLTMKGMAKSFAAVVLQSDAFAKTHDLHEPIFSNLNLDDLGNVQFEFAAFVEPGLVSYGASLDRALGTTGTNTGGTSSQSATTTP